MHDLARPSAARYPRSRVAGIALLAIDLVWSFWLVSTMEMGEFSAFRRPFLIALPIGFFLTLRFVDEFLTHYGTGWSAWRRDQRRKRERENREGVDVS